MSSNDDEDGDGMEASSESTNSSTGPNSAFDESSSSQELSRDDSDVMIIDEIAPKVKTNANTSNKSAEQLDRAISTSTSKKPVKKEGNGVQQTKDPKVEPKDKPVSKQTLSKQERKKSRAERRLLLSHPDRIVKNVLSKSSFKVPNLSQVVDKKFSTPHLKTDIMNALKSVPYEDTTMDVNMSVLPSKYSNYTVNVDPCAITYLPCMYEIPERRKRQKFQGGNRKRHKGGGQSGSQQKQQQQKQQPQQQQQQQQPQQKQHQQQQQTKTEPASRSEHRSARNGFRSDTNQGGRKKFDHSRLGPKVRWNNKKS